MPYKFISKIVYVKLGKKWLKKWFKKQLKKWLKKEVTKRIIKLLRGKKYGK